MLIDALSHVAAVSRTVDTVDRDGRPAKLLVAERTYPTSPEDAWSALTDPERIPRWFLPITGDLHVGGRFQLEGNAGGEVLACDPPQRFEITWEYGGDVSWVTVEVQGEPGDMEAHVVLEHVAHVPDDLWDQYGPGAVGIGWELGMMGLDLHLASGEPVDAEAVMAWQASAEGRDLIVRVSAGWVDASIDDGTEPEKARAAGARVAAFYTGEEVGEE
jgi:uncharacterized protein YndB with AHSA1/START domain